MLPRNDLDRLQIAFDDHRLVANAGLLLPVTLRPATWVCVNSSTTTLTSQMRRGGRMWETRC